MKLTLPRLMGLGRGLVGLDQRLRLCGDLLLVDVRHLLVRRHALGLVFRDGHFEVSAFVSLPLKDVKPQHLLGLRARRTR